MVTVGDKGLTAITGERICTLFATFVATAKTLNLPFSPNDISTRPMLLQTYLDGALISSRIP